MIICTGIENPWTKRVCKIGRDITGLGNKSNGGRFGGMSEAKKLLIFTRCKSHSLRWRRRHPQLEVEAVQKIGLHEQCEADDHVTDNTGLEGNSSITVGTIRLLASASVATTSTPRIIARVRWSKHH